VCRVNLVGCSKSEFESGSASEEKAAKQSGMPDVRSRFHQVLANTSCVAANYCARELNTRAQKRCENANTEGRFVNVTGGSYGACQQLLKEMSAAGFKCKTAPGPLLRPSHHKHLLHQPVSVGNMSKLITEAMKQAHVNQVAKGEGAVPDVKPGAEPKWGTHSARRGGAKRAIDLIPLSGVEKIQIDFHFGWDEMSHAKLHPMQWMYAGTACPQARRMVTAFF
jgi:hypothetical protein